MTDQTPNQNRRQFLGASALVLSGVMSGIPAMAKAADEKLNSFTPVYRGAITRNESGKVNVHPITYRLHGLDIAANLYE